MQGVVNNLGNKNYQTTVNNEKYDLNKAKDFLLKISTENITKNEAQELYNNLIKPDVGALKKSKGRRKSIRLNILSVLENIESSVFEGYYSNCKDFPEASYETAWIRKWRVSSKKKCCKESKIKKKKIEYNRREKK